MSETTIEPDASNPDLTDRTALDISLLVLRVIVGVIMMAHGAQKLFGAFGGGGMQPLRQPRDARLSGRDRRVFWRLGHDRRFSSAVFRCSEHRDHDRRDRDGARQERLFPQQRWLRVQLGPDRFIGADRARRAWQIRAGALPAASQSPLC